MSALEDKDAIRELLAEYCFLLDSYQLKELSQIFAEGGEWTSRNGGATGPPGSSVPATGETVSQPAELARVQFKGCAPMLVKV